VSDFTGRVVLITGAAGGIGQALSRLFGERGATIAALDRDEAVIDFAGALSEDGIRSAAAVADIGAADDVAAAIADLRTVLGPVTVLINNAGYSSCPTLEKSTPASWAEDVNLNLNGAFNCTHAVLQDLKDADEAAIVNISSVNGLMAYGDPAYGAAKAGLINLTKTLAMEYGRFGIRANVVCPATVRTPIWNHRIERQPEILDELARWYPLRRIVDPIEVANAVAFLASKEASGITGAVLPVDCGLGAGNIVMTRDLTLEEF
jgi:NAD(P)-dependent dehydrogenase (short-subunit alcohol dehydrogenase family)